VTGTAQLLRFSSVDDYLGPSQGRFFGSGYRRADYQVTDVAVAGGTGPGDGVRASVDVAYPTDWSRKADADLRPHLSTIDMLMLGAQLSEAHLAHAYGLDDAMRRWAWIRKVTLRAGNTPQEDLTGLPATASLLRSVPDDASGSVVSTYQARVGAMQAKYDIVHPVARRDAGDAHYDTLGQALGDPAERYFGAGFQQQRHDITDVEVDMGLLTASARAAVGRPAGLTTAGLEGDYQPSWSLLDCFVVNLQLTQILMYELDQVARERSNTLWMLRTTLEAAGPSRPGEQPARTDVALTDKHLVSLRGGVWRDVTVAGSLGGIALRCTFAHELPSGTPSAA
jgi:hypothetical protein